MSRIRAINVKAQKMAEPLQRDVRGYAFSDCCASFAPGWEVGTADDADPCPWKSDLTLCWGTCWWMGQVPDHISYADWFDETRTVVRTDAGELP